MSLAERCRQADGDTQAASQLERLALAPLKDPIQWLAARVHAARVHEEEHRSFFVTRERLAYAGSRSAASEYSTPGVGNPEAKAVLRLMLLPGLAMVWHAAACGKESTPRFPQGFPARIPNAPSWRHPCRCREKIIVLLTSLSARRSPPNAEI
jgi:hypothetical protein